MSQPYNPLFEGQTGTWEVVIGLEIHAQITSKAKLFSGASTAFGAEPNAQVSFVDAGMPGVLPVLNQHCVEQAIKTGLGLNGQINLTSVFDRKNYFYPDLPNGYQISQFERPIVGKGYVDIELSNGQSRRIGVTRLHLEQDAGKSVHDYHPYKSYIDLNRAGIGLMEIVSEPDMRSAEEAVAYVKKIRTLVRYLGTCDGNMDEGSLRVDANVSVRRPGDPFGTRAEIKNVNSIKFLARAIMYEVQRQIELIEAGQQVIQETRLFDATQGLTRSMRTKEQAHDYRYFPDPDLPPLILEQAFVDHIKSTMPELPDAKKHRFEQELGLPSYDADLLASEKETADFYEEILAYIKDKGRDNKNMAKLAANWVMGDFFAALNRDTLTIQASLVRPQHLAKLVLLLDSGVISSKIAKEVFEIMWESQEDPDHIVESRGLKQLSDDTMILAAIDEVLKREADKVEEYRAGKDKLFGYFVGQLMCAMGGKANPGMVNNLLRKKLEGQP